MLVYLKNNMAYTSIAGKRVYGEWYAYGSMGPTDIPIELFRKNTDILKEAYYTKDWLSIKFNTDFPDIQFKLSNLKNLDIDVLIEIARCVGIDYIKTKNISSTEKRALIKIIRRNIS